MVHELPSDVFLLDQIANDPQTGWANMYEHYGMRLRTHIVSKIGSEHEHDADDLMQETMLAAVGAFATYKGQARLYTWLCGIAQHKIADHWRRQRPTHRLPMALPAPPADESIFLYEALLCLPEDYHLAIVLRYFGGHSVGEIARRLGRSYKATESLLSRAKEHLRCTLDEPDDILTA